MMTLDDTLRAIRDAIQVDVGNRGLARDPADNLINAFPDDFASACRSIAVHPHPHVGIVTGFMIPSVNPPTGETDGPPGALFLANVLSNAGIPCILFSDASGLSALHAGIQHREVVILKLPEKARPEMLRPLTHLVAIERCGPSHKNGRNHTMRGRDITDLTAPAHLLFEGQRSFVTIGIGDGGNEIGMGKIPYSTICKNIPNGDVVACRTATDYLIVAGVSNWGAYALVAGIMCIRGIVDVPAFDSERERQLLVDLVEKGPLVDGVSGKRTATVDGLTFEDYIRPLQRIRTLLETRHAVTSEQ